jgi:hypothetical protein
MYVRKIFLLYVREHFLLYVRKNFFQPFFCICPEKVFGLFPKKSGDGGGGGGGGNFNQENFDR